jgi:hypothetical protein
MKALTNSDLRDLQRKVEALSDEAEPQATLTVLLRWIESHQEKMMSPPFSDYGLDKFSQFRLEDYPVSKSSLRGRELEHFRRTVSKLSLKDLAFVAMFFRDSLEALLMPEVDGECPRCNGYSIAVFKNKCDGKLLLLCKTCGFGWYLDAAQDTGGKREYEFATERELREYGLV